MMSFLLFSIFFLILLIIIAWRKNIRWLRMIGGILIFLLIPLYIDFLGVEKFVTNWNIGEWSGFLGSYLGGRIGVFITLGSIWWQLNENKNQFQKSLGEQKRQFDFQIKQEKIKMQLGSLKIIEYYFTILFSKLKDTILSPDGEEVKFYRKLFYGNLFIDSELISDNKDYFIISKKILKF